MRVTLVAMLFCCWTFGVSAKEQPPLLLLGTISDAEHSSGSGVAMIKDKRSNRTHVIKVGGQLPGTKLKLIAVSRKSATLLDGDKTLQLYRDAWDAARPEEDRASYQRRSDFAVSDRARSYRNNHLNHTAPPPTASSPRRGHIVYPDEGVAVDDLESEEPYYEMTDEDSPYAN